MRIGIDMLALQSDDSRHRGVGRYARHFLDALFAAAPDRSFLLYSHDRLPIEDYPSGPNAEVRRIGPDRSRGETRLGQAIQRVAQENPDQVDALLVLNPFELHPEYLTPARPIEGPALIALVHDVIPFLFQEHYLRDERHARRFYRSLERLRQYDHLVTNSESTRADCAALLGMPADRLTTILAASDATFFQPAARFPIPGPDRRTLHDLGVTGPFVFTLSGMDDRKNLDGLLEAYRLLPPELRESHQLVVTCELTPAYTDRIRALARRRGVDDRLVLTGGVDDRALRTLYQQCRLFVFPSKYEGFGIPILEAMHCGAPVLAGQNSAQPEVVGEAGRLVNVADPAELSQAMADLLASPESLRELGERGLVRSREFHWSKVADRAIGALDRAAGRPAIARGHSPRRRDTSRPRLAIFSPWAPKATGIADYAANLVRALSDTYRIDLYHEPGYVPEPALGGGALASYDWRLFERNDRVIGYRGVVHQMGNSFYHQFVYEALQRHGGIVALHDFSLAGFQFWYAHRNHGHDPNGYLRAQFAFDDPGAPPVEDAEIQDWMAEPGGFQDAMARRARHLNRRIFAHAESVVVHSPWCHREAERCVPDLADRTCVIPHGADVRIVTPCYRASVRERFGIPADALVVASFGILTNGKMNTEALDAFAVLAAREPKATFLLVGEDWEQGQARRHTAALGLNDRVQFLGRQPAEAFDELLTVTDIGISLRRPPTFGETSGALLHLLRHGVPTIVNSVATFADYPDDTVRKVDWETEGPARLERALLQLAQDPAERHRLGRAALRYVERAHRWSLAAERYIDCIERGPRARRTRRSA